MIVAAQSDPEFLKALQSADLAIPDGIGIVWAISLRNFCQRIQFRKLHRVLKQKQLVITHLSGLDFMEALIGESAKNGWKVMLLGGKPGVGGESCRKSEEDGPLRERTVLYKIHQRSP